MSISVRQKLKIETMLDALLEEASSNKEIILPNDVKLKLDHIFESIDAAKSGYTNLLTDLVCSAVDRNIDPRYHRKPGKVMPAPENGDDWFSGRTISEDIIYPWMEKQICG